MKWTIPLITSSHMLLLVFAVGVIAIVTAAV